MREIETCNEIEDYVSNYLGDSQQAKDFAHQFYINRESQVKQLLKFNFLECLATNPTISILD